MKLQQLSPLAYWDVWLLHGSWMCLPIEKSSILTEWEDEIQLIVRITLYRQKKASTLEVNNTWRSRLSPAKVYASLNKSVSLGTLPCLLPWILVKLNLSNWKKSHWATFSKQKKINLTISSYPDFCLYASAHFYFFLWLPW